MGGINKNIEPIYTRGRPPSRDWEGERFTIALLLKAGYGFLALAKFYDMSPAGMRLVLRRLGLRTIWQEAQDGQKS